MLYSGLHTRKYGTLFIYETDRYSGLYSFSYRTLLVKRKSTHMPKTYLVRYVHGQVCTIIMDHLRMHLVLRVS